MIISSGAYRPLQKQDAVWRARSSYHPTSWTPNMQGGVFGQGLGGGYQVVAPSTYLNGQASGPYGQGMAQGHGRPWGL